MEITKHVGLIKSTNKRCVVAFMQLPDDRSRSLVAIVDGMDHTLEREVMAVVSSVEGQAATDLANVLGRRMMPNSTVTILAELHNRGHLRATDIDDIEMTPRPGTRFELREILVAMGMHIPEKIVGAQDVAAGVPVPTANITGTSDERNAIALNLLAEADLLQLDVNHKREQAYAYAPNLRPAVTPITEQLVEQDPPAESTGQ